LPFGAVNASGHYAATTFWASQLSFSGVLQAYVPLIQSYVVLQELTVAGLNSNITDNDLSASSTEIMINVSYNTSS